MRKHFSITLRNFYFFPWGSAIEISLEITQDAVSSLELCYCCWSRIAHWSHPTIRSGIEMNKFPPGCGSLRAKSDISPVLFILFLSSVPNLACLVLAFLSFRLPFSSHPKSFYGPCFLCSLIACSHGCDRGKSCLLYPFFCFSLQGLFLTANYLIQTDKTLGC